MLFILRNIKCGGSFLSSLTLLNKKGITTLLTINVNTETTPPFLR
jgi:hypothetical protein